MSYEDYARKIAEKAEEAREIERKVKEQRARRRQAVMDAMRPLYDVARSHIMTDLKEHGLVEAIRRHEMRKLALDRAVNDTI
jgi:hypothetical protein